MTMKESCYLILTLITVFITFGHNILWKGRVPSRLSCPFFFSLCDAARWPISARITLQMLVCSSCFPNVVAIEPLSFVKIQRTRSCGTGKDNPAWRFVWKRQRNAVKLQGLHFLSASNLNAKRLQSCSALFVAHPPSCGLSVYHCNNLFGLEMCPRGKEWKSPSAEWWFCGNASKGRGGEQRERHRKEPNWPFFRAAIW